MKNLYLLLLCPAFFTAAQSQTWQLDFNAMVTSLHPLPNDRWLIGGNTAGTEWLFANGTFIETSLDGSDFYSPNSGSSLNSSYNFRQINVIPLQDGRRIIAGSVDECDVSHGGLIELQEPDGTPVWTLATTPPSITVPHLTTILLNAQQEIVAIGEQTILLVDLESGNLLQEKQIAGIEFSDITLNADSSGYFLVESDQIYSMDGDLNLTPIYSNPVPGKTYTRIVKAPNNGFFALQNDYKILFRRWTAIGFQGYTLDPGFSVNDITATDNGVVFCGQKGTSGMVGYIVDSTQVETGGFALPAPEIIPQRIRVNPTTGQIIIAGIELHGPSPRTWNSQQALSSGNQHFWIQSFQPDGTTQGVHGDAAITEVVTHQWPKVEPYDDGPWSSYEWYIYNDGKFSVRVKNNGSQPLQSIQVLAARYSVFDLGFCTTENYVDKQYTALDLSPGEDTLLYIGNVGYGYTERVTPWQLCFWVTTPNGLPDINHENDYACVELDLTTATTERPVNRLNLSPNPAADVLFIENLREHPGRCRVFNSAGQLVAEQEPIGEQGVYRLDTSRLPGGFYVLKTDQGWGKFVKN